MMEDQDPQIPQEDKVGEPAAPDTVLVGTEDAAKALGIASRTVRKRIGTGELTASKMNGAWFVELPREKVLRAGIEIPEVDGEPSEHDRLPIVGDRRAGRSASGMIPMPEPVDLGPMAALIADLTRKSIEASTAAAMYQERARQLEEQNRSATLALESGQQDHQRKIEEMESAIERARQEARDQTNSEWRSKSWWQRLKGE